METNQNRKKEKEKNEKTGRKSAKEEGDNNPIAKIITVSNFHFETRTNNSFSIVKIDVV